MRYCPGCGQRISDASELGRLYRRVARGQTSSIEGYPMAAILNVLRQCLESGMIEQRLESWNRRPMATEAFRRS